MGEIKYINARKDGKPKKNCFNCKYGYIDSDGGEYSPYYYVVCKKNDTLSYKCGDQGNRYWEKGKRCCELSESLEIESNCAACGEEMVATTKDKNMLCMDCWHAKEYKSGEIDVNAE